jgi:hypothetical protein
MPCSCRKGKSASSGSPSGPNTRPRRRGPSHHGPAERVLPVDAGARGRVPAGLPGARIGFVAYSPWGRGFLTGTIEKPEDLAADDFRRTNPRSKRRTSGKTSRCRSPQADGRTERVHGGAAGARLGARPGEDVIPPRTKRRRWLEENIAALDVNPYGRGPAAPRDDRPEGGRRGERYGEAMMNFMRKATEPRRRT